MIDSIVTKDITTFLTLHEVFYEELQSCNEKNSINVAKLGKIFKIKVKTHFSLKMKIHSNRENTSNYIKITILFIKMHPRS